MSVTIRRYVAIVRKRIWLVVAVLILGIGASIVYSLQAPKIYEATATVVVNPQAPHVNKDDEVIELGAGSFVYMRDYYNTQLEVLTSFPLARATVLQGSLTKFYDQLAPKDKYPDLTEDQRIDEAAENLLIDLAADQHKDSRIIALRVRNKDPDVAEALANAHVASYLAFIRNKRTIGTGQASELLSSELSVARKQLEETEARIATFKSLHGLVTQSFDDKQNTVVTELQRYTAALADAKVKRIDLAAQKGRAEALASEDVLDSPIFALSSDTQLVNQLKSEYMTARERFLEVDATYGPKSEEQRAAKDKVDALHLQLQNESKRVVREISERYEAALTAEQGYQALVDQRKHDTEELDKLYAEYAPLVRDEKYAEDQYTKLAGRLDDSRHESQNDLINVDPHEMARDADKVLPRIPLNIALAAVLSLMLGLGIVFLLDQMDRTIKTADGIDNVVGSPVLGIIPIVGETKKPKVDTDEAVAARDLFVFKHPTSQAAECCRSIRTNIIFSAAERPMKTITVSSARPREGKTTTTIYLGMAMAQGGQKVLLLDTDLRRPRLHKSLGVSRERGLTSILVGDAKYDDVIKATEVPDLFVLPCGPTPPNPAELLLTNRFKTVLHELSQRFDRVLLDSPPLLAVTDAVVLARNSDGVILVAKSNQTSIDDLVTASRQLHDVTASILGVVVNTLDISDRRYGYYYAAYGGYGGYGDTSKAEAR
ncbi:MAG TPA: polysaccharide biosynthesis tyrosine autokinase [Kofleriaceae bacterium]|nr:polysaccharide biosynthesis tyrosine autokinase [Kofleriaceae bacterium]